MIGTIRRIRRGAHVETKTERREPGDSAMTRKQAACAAQQVQERYPHLIAEPYQSAIDGDWAVEVKQRKPWKTSLFSKVEVEDFLKRAQPCG